MKQNSYLKKKQPFLLSVHTEFESFTFWLLRIFWSFWKCLWKNTGGFRLKEELHTKQLVIIKTCMKTASNLWKKKPENLENKYLNNSISFLSWYLHYSNVGKKLKRKKAKLRNYTQKTHVSDFLIFLHSWIWKSLFVKMYVQPLFIIYILHTIYLSLRFNFSVRINLSLKYLYNINLHGMKLELYNNYCLTFLLLLLIITYFVFRCHHVC